MTRAGSMATLYRDSLRGGEARPRLAMVVGRGGRHDACVAPALPASNRTSLVLAGPPLVGLLEHPQVDERLSLANAVDRAEPVDDEEQQGVVVHAQGLDEDIVRT